MLPVWRKHRLWKEDLAAQVGIIGRKYTNLYMFSYEYVNLAQIYMELTDKDYDPIRGDVSERLLALLQSETYNKDPPAHWTQPTDRRRCIGCDDKVEPENAIQHIRSCLLEQADIKAKDLLTRIAETLPKHARDASSKSTTSMYFWCSFCRAVVFEGVATAARQEHLARHLPDALKAMKQYGYPGVSVGQVRKGARAQDFVFSGCIFCLHDESLRPEERLLDLHRHSILVHLVLHLDSPDELPCPGLAAGTCSFPDRMDAKTMKEHILTVHYGKESTLQLRDTRKGKKKLLEKSGGVDSDEVDDDLGSLQQRQRANKEKSLRKSFNVLKDDLSDVEERSEPMQKRPRVGTMNPPRKASTASKVVLTGISDSKENAQKEIALWFKPEELASYKSAQFDWVYEKP
ncbi:nucleoside diphosphate kinase Ndk1 [Cytospora paraplurivora]|uniref:Nucleoside diphosphate kinase Ndk1 n=1 Tax=Cytospora paraplurivora TaxID=2898453 RepID=A0AAN9U8N3_9PEZI